MPCQNLSNMPPGYSYNTNEKQTEYIECPDCHYIDDHCQCHNLTYTPNPQCKYCKQEAIEQIIDGNPTIYCPTCQQTYTP